MDPVERYRIRRELVLGLVDTSLPWEHPDPPPPVAAADEKASGAATAARSERAARPQKEKALNCPKCNSTNTKFCYYNNYSLQQPRYFCKTCRRYWTEGGSLRNVPVGGGSRKNKRSDSNPAVSSAATSAAVSAGTIPVGLAAANNHPKLMHEDLNQQVFPHHGDRPALLKPPEFAAFPSLESSSSSVCNPEAGGAAGAGAGRALSAMELLRSTGCYVPLQHVQLGMPAEYAAAGFGPGDFRMPPPPQSHQSLLGFSLDTHAGLQESAAGRLLFPFEDLKPAGDGSANNNGAAAADQYENSKDDHQAAGDGSGDTGGHDDTPGIWSNSILGNGTSNGCGGPW
ncbi:unnamed protein product [Urochloa decumbens]|uniref:Dof zinc finger protein n=1 Tax=Urochloa decumbens TaxID=240449 RepID=A0ABC9AT80_9POAL